MVDLPQIRLYIAPLFCKMQCPGVFSRFNNIWDDLEGEHLI